MPIFEFDWQFFFGNLVRIVIAFAMALPVALDRELHDKSAGFRTFPLVSIACCGFILISRQVLPDPAAQARVFQGLITGIGFIGGGAIVKDKQTVKGMATAASIWSTAAIGISIAWDRLDIAMFLSLASFLTLRYFPPVKDKIKENAGRLKADAE